MQRSILAATLLVASYAGAPATACDPHAGPATAVVVPGKLDLGTRTASTTVHEAVWLINPGDEPLEVLSAKGSCGCTVVDFTASTLPPKACLEVPIRVTAPKAHGRHKTVTVTFTIRDREPVTLPVTIGTEGDEPLRAQHVEADPQPRVEALKQHLGDLYGESFTDFRTDGNIVTAVAWQRDSHRPQGWLTCRFDDNGTLRSTTFESIAPL